MTLTMVHLIDSVETIVLCEESDTKHEMRLQKETSRKCTNANQIV